MTKKNEEKTKPVKAKKAKPEPNMANKESAIIRNLVDSYYGVQKARIETNNRIAMISRDFQLSEDESKRLHDMVDEPIMQAEKNIQKELKKHSSDHPIYEWANGIYGIGPILVAGVVSGIQDPTKFATVSKVWRYCGLAVIDGEAEKRKKGEKLAYSPFMKTLCWKVGESFVKSGRYYREVYDRYKAEYRERFPEPVDTVSSKGKTYQKYTDGHIHAMAKRKTVKLFIAHLYEKWLELEGKPYRNPYCERLGHKREPVPATDN